MEENYVIGVDFGSDSVRCLVVNADDGCEIASTVEYYPRWASGKYCDPATNRYRQHPLDYLESLETVIRKALAECGHHVVSRIRAISFDTTASTPVLTDRYGTPLALLPRHAENPDAMFMLWKDHSAVHEADEINELAHLWETDYTKYSGGIYSCEWVWAKVLHALRTAPSLRNDAWAWVEHCDWISGTLTGNTDPKTMLRSRCAAGHKAMWHESWGGLPSQNFLTALDPLLDGFREHLYTETPTNDTCAGTLVPEWAARLGLGKAIKVGLGAIDCHIGAIGAQITPNVLVKTIGTSTCDILTVHPEEIQDRVIRGICGQVDGSVIPEYLGLEAGQSAFGDIYAWFKGLMAWPLEHLCGGASLPDEAIIPKLSELAVRLEPTESAPVALDWMNGRRTPDANPRVQGTISGITLATTAPMLFRALAEATAFGSRAINERFTQEQIGIKDVIAIGGIAHKSPLVMQIMADVGGLPIKVAASSQTCALGAAMCAAVAGGIHPSVEKAQQAMGRGFATVYYPDPARRKVYNVLYEKYLGIGRFFDRG